MDDNRGLFQIIETGWTIPFHYIYSDAPTFNMFACGCGKEFTSFGKLRRHVKRKNR